MNRLYQNTHQWGFHGFGNGCFFAADFCHTVQRMNFELVFGCRALFCPASFLYFCNQNQFNMKNLVFLAVLVLMMATSCNNQNKKTTQVAETESKVEQTSGIYDITVKDIDGSDVSLANYKGKVLLVVNVASKCGLTPQYEGLEALYLKYKDQGLEILAFPCNQFLGQEPGTNEEIQSFCSLTYNVTFPLFDKIDVNGENESPLYTYLKEQTPRYLRDNLGKALVP